MARGLSAVSYTHLDVYKRQVPDKDKRITPVEVIMKVSTKYGFNLRRDSVTSLDLSLIHI